jgi:hypothetical protein
MTHQLPEGGRRYRHYKNKDYEVLAIATHSETLEPLVVYRALYGEGQVWVRPAAMFLETVVVEGVSQPRFCLLATKTN